MSKRIVCFLLALIMFVGLIPAGAISASAASLSASENVIKLIKDFESFVPNAYPDGLKSNGDTRYSYGYGTEAPDKDAVINEKNADKALREELRVIDAKVNNFAAANGLNLSQTKFDALVSFSYNVGWGWMSQSSYRITKAVASGATGNDFLQAMTLWSNVDSIPSVGLINRRMAEANLYLNGVYNKTAPSNYTYVKFDANGGVLGEDKVQAYNVNSPVTITAVPVRAADEDGTKYTFLGWYESTSENATWVGALNTNTAKKTLYARWQKDTTAVENGKVIGTPADYIINGMNFASNKVYAVPNTNNAAVETINQNETFRVTAEYIDNNGDKWLKISTGWVKLGEIKPSTTTGTGTPTVTVTAKTLNVRKNAGTSFDSVAELKKGDQVIITETKEIKGALWGKCEKGWIDLKYTNYGTITNLNGTTTDGNNAANNVVIATGTVLTNATNLNVRTGAGLQHGIVATLVRNTKVDIYQITNVNGHGWGRIGEGRWVCLDYVNYKMVETVKTETDISNGPAVIGEPFKFKATVNVDGLNIYANPTNTLANPIGSLNKNDNVSIFEFAPAGSGDTATVFGKIISNNIIGWIQLDKTTYTASGVVSTADGKDIDLMQTGGTTIGSLKNGTAVTILQISTNGTTLFGRIKEGWINLASVKLNTTKAPILTGSEINASINSSAPTTGKVIYTGIVNSGINLNVRLGAGVNFDVVHSLTNGTNVKVYDKTMVNGHYWGKLGENAWICLSYVTETTGTTEDTSSSTTNNSNLTAMDEMATVVNCTVGVNIRSTPSVTGALLGSAPLNSRVKVLETAVYNGTKWARTELGWISMLYLKLDSEVSYASNSTVSVNGLFSATVLVNEINVYDSISSTGTAIATLKKGASVYVAEIQSNDYETVSGKVTVDGKTGWIDLSNTTFVAKGQVSNASGANVRSTYAVVDSPSNVVEKLANGTFVTVLEIRAENVGNGSTRLWGKLASNKWIALENVNLMATSASAPSNSTLVTTGLGKIAYAPTVNVRKAAGTTNDIVTKLNRGTEVVLYEETLVDDAIWCRISTASVNGWVSKEYIDVIFTPTTQQNNTITDTNTGNTVVTTPTETSNYATGIVNSNIPLKVRQQPDINAAIVTELPKGMTVTIYEQRKGGSMDWGRVDNGWISLSFVTMTSTGSTGAGDMGTIIKAFSVVNVRAEATTESAKVGEVMVGSRVEVLDQKYVNGYTWYRINNGWVHGDYIELDAPFVGNNTNNNTNTESNTPATGPEDEVGGMSTTAILKHRVNEVVAFHKFENSKFVENGTKLVNGETVIITELKGYGIDVWANTKHGWFNLSNESINFTAIGLVNTTDNNYLNVYSEAGKSSTAPVDKIRDGASITLTGVAVSNGKLWGKTASGWVDLVHVEMTCVKQGAMDGDFNEPVTFKSLTANELFKAKSKGQHLAIAAYNQVGGDIIGRFQPDGTNYNIYVVEVKASSTGVWGRVAVTDTAVNNVWIKLSDVDYIVDTVVSVACTATTSAGGNVAKATYKVNDGIKVNNLTVSGTSIYGQICEGDNTGAWVNINNLNKWTAVPEAETPVNFGAKINGTPKTLMYTYDAVNGNVKGTLRDTAALVCISEVKADGSTLWGKTITNKGDRWIKLGDLNLIISDVVTVVGKGYNAAGGTTEIKSFKLGDTISGNALDVNDGKFYVKDTASNSWIDTACLKKWNGVALPTVGAALATSGNAKFPATTKYEVPIKNADFTGNAGTAAGGKNALVTNIVKNGNTLWAEVRVTVTAADYTQTSDVRYIELGHLNFTLNGKTTAQANVRSTMSTGDSTNVYELLEANVALKIKGLTCGADHIWATVEYAAGAGGIGYVAIDNVNMGITIN